MKERRFAIDMAGFAVSLDLIAAENARFRQSARPGCMEDDFIGQVVGDTTQLEVPLTEDRLIRVWHTKLRPDLRNHEAESFYTQERLLT